MRGLVQDDGATLRVMRLKVLISVLGALVIK